MNKWIKCLIGISFVVTVTFGTIFAVISSKHQAEIIPIGGDTIQPVAETIPIRGDVMSPVAETIPIGGDSLVGQS